MEKLLLPLQAEQLHLTTLLTMAQALWPLLLQILSPLQLLQMAYDVFVQDANGCTTTATSISVSEPANLNAVVNITSNYNGQDMIVFVSGWRVTITASGGTAPYQFDFDNQGFFTTNSIINGLSAGT